MSQQSHIKAQIMFEAKKLCIDLIGVASSERFEHAPPKHKPTDIMAGAKSIIVLALKCLDGPMKNKHWTSYTIVHEGNDSRLNNAAYYRKKLIVDYPAIWK